MNRRQNHTLARLIPLALCLAGGAVLGQVAAAAVPETTAEELRRYLSGYYQAGGGYPISGEISGAYQTGGEIDGGYQTGSGIVVTAADTARALSAYSSCPLLAFLLGWTGAGAAALCILAATFGFLISFSIGCFGAAYGRAGIVIAAAALGIRCAVTLICFFLLALPYFPKTERRLDRRRLEECAALLAAGVCAEMLIVPRLIRLALAWVLS